MTDKLEDFNAKRTSLWHRIKGLFFIKVHQWATLALSRKYVGPVVTVIMTEELVHDDDPGKFAQHLALMEEGPVPIN